LNCLGHCHRSKHHHWRCVNLDVHFQTSLDHHGLERKTDELILGIAECLCELHCARHADAPPAMFDIAQVRAGNSKLAGKFYLRN
jgi:hypothetical protein